MEVDYSSMKYVSSSDIHKVMIHVHSFFFGGGGGNISIFSVSDVDFDLKSVHNAVGQRI